MFANDVILNEILTFGSWRILGLPQTQLHWLMVDTHSTTIHDYCHIENQISFFLCIKSQLE